MPDTYSYQSPLGTLYLTGDAVGLTGLWFAGQAHADTAPTPLSQPRHVPWFQAACRWLDVYFSGDVPETSVPFHLTGTAFQMAVWQRLCAIPYGHTTTYGRIAAQIAAQRGIARMSAQAVGGAVGRNPIAILIPCHRVIGANGSLTGFAGGIETKRALLELEGVDPSAKK